MPVRTVAQARNPLRQASGSAEYLRSDTFNVVSMNSAGVFANRGDVFCDLGELRLIPIDPFGQVRNHCDATIFEADRAGVPCLP